MQLEHINVNIFGLSALFLRIISVGYVVSSGLPESWTFIQRLYIQLYSWFWATWSVALIYSLRPASVVEVGVLSLVLPAPGGGGDSAVFRLASCAHIHSHCLVLLPLMSRFWKGKPEFEERWYGKADRIRKMRSLSVLSLLVVFFPWANSENRRLLKDFPLASVCRWSYADNFASLF